MLGVKIGNLDPLAVKMLTVKKKKKLSHETEGFYWGSRTRFCKQLRRCYQLAVCSVCDRRSLLLFRFKSSKAVQKHENKRRKSKIKSAVFSFL